MRNIFHYDNAVIFDGMTGEYKTDISVSPKETTYARDLTGLDTSRLVGIELNKSVKSKDLIWHLDRWGTVLEPIYEDSKLSCEVAFLSDAIQRRIFNLNSVTILQDFEVDNRQPLTIRAVGQHKFLCPTGKEAFSDEIFRQLMLKYPFKEVCSFEDKLIELIPIIEEEWFIRLDDPEITIVKEDYTNEAVNELTLINKENELQYKHWYYSNSHGVTDEPTTLERPPVNDAMEVEKDEWDDHDIAVDFFKKQEFTSEVEIVVPYPSKIFTEELYSREVTLILKDESLFKSKITKVLIDGAKMSITFGTSRTSLTDILKGDR